MAVIAGASRWLDACAGRPASPYSAPTAATTGSRRARCARDGFHVVSCSWVMDVGSGPAVSRPTFRLRRTVCWPSTQADAAIGCRKTRTTKRRKVSRAAVRPSATADLPKGQPMNRPIHRSRARRRPEARRLHSLAARGRRRRSRRRRRSPPTPARRERRDRAAGGRALHLRRLQLLPAGRPLAVEAEGRPERGRARLPRRLLGPARLEGPLRQRRLHRPPGRAAGEQRRALQLHAAGRGRRPRPHGLAGHRGAAAPIAPPAPVDAALARDGDRVMATVRRRRRRCAAAARRLLGGHRAGPRHRRQGRREPGATLQHDYVVRDYETVPAWSARAPARRRPSPSSCRRGPTLRRIRASVNLVVVDADSGRPVQALKIGC